MFLQSSRRTDGGWRTDVNIERNSTAEVLGCIQAPEHCQVSTASLAFCARTNNRLTHVNRDIFYFLFFFRLFSFARFDYDFVLFVLSFRLLDVCHGQLERDRQLVLFLVFEHLEEDLAGYLVRIGSAGMPARTIQVRHVAIISLIIISSFAGFIYYSFGIGGY